MGKYSVIKINIAFNFLGAIWTSFISLIFIPKYISLMGADSYGLVGIFALVNSIFALFDAGLTPALTREIAKFSAGSITLQKICNLIRSIEVVFFVAGLNIFLLIQILSPWIASDWIQSKEIGIDVAIKAIGLIGFIVGIKWIMGLYRSALSGLQDQAWSNKCLIFFSTAKGLGSVLVLENFSPTIEVFFVFQAVITIIELISMMARLYFMVPIAKLGRFQIKSIKSVWHYSLGVWISTLIGFLLVQSDKIYLSKYLSLADFGYYTLASTVSSSLYLLPGPISQALFPLLTKLANSENYNASALSVVYHKASQLNAIVLGSVGMILIFFAKPLLIIWLSNFEIAEHLEVLLSVLTFGVMLNGLMWIPGQLQLAFGWTSLRNYMGLALLVIVYPLMMLFLPTYGALGAAWIWVFINTTYIILTISIMHKHILRDQKWKWYFQDTLTPIAVAAIMAGTARYFFDTQILGRLLSFLYIFISGIFTILISAFASPYGKSSILKWIKSRGMM